MTNLKSTFTAFVMIFVLVFGTTFANAGIIVAAKKESNRCQSTTTKTPMETGIIVAYIGIIVAYTGIIVALKTDPSAPCSSTPTPTKEEPVLMEKGIIVA